MSLATINALTCYFYKLASYVSAVYLDTSAKTNVAIYWIQTNLQGSNLRMLYATFKMFISHYIMESVGNLYSPCLLYKQPKR